MDKIKRIIVLAVVLSFAGGFVLPLKQAKAFLLPGVPQPVVEVGPSGAANITTAAMTTAQKIQTFLKDFIIRPLVRRTANTLQNMIVNKMVAQISGVNQGQPNFITNWRNEILDSQGRGNDVFRSVLADAKLCPYFQNNLQKAFGADAVKYGGVIAGAIVKNSKGEVVYRNKTTIPGLPSFQNISNCTLDSSFNVNTFKNDFAKGGGWDTWNELIQPQNNFFGAYTLAIGEQVKQMITESQSSQNQSIAGGGFLGQRLNLSGKASPSGCVGAGGINRCIFVGKTVTPAKLAADVNSLAFDAKLKQVGLASELPDVVFGIIGAVITGLVQGLTNEMGLKNYDAIQGAVDLFSEAGSQEAGGTAASAATYKSCMDACDTEFDSCMKQNSPAYNASASGENTYVCSDALESCEADCSRQFSP